MTIESIPVSPIVRVAPALRLERQPCTRCGGSGHYSYCQMYGTTCFLCQGKKEILTRRGAAAAEFLKSLRMVRVGDLKVGDVVKTFAGWTTITELVPGVQEGASSVGGGPLIPYRREGVNVVCKLCTLVALPADHMIEIKQTPEQARANLILAIEYQNTLTKQGTVRKRS